MSRGGHTEERAAAPATAADCSSCTPVGEQGGSHRGACSSACKRCRLPQLCHEKGTGLVGEGQATWLGLCLQGRADHTDAVTHISMGTARRAASAGDPAVVSNRMVSSTENCGWAPAARCSRLHGSLAHVACSMITCRAKSFCRAAAHFLPSNPKQIPVPGHFHVDQRLPAY